MSVETPPKLSEKLSSIQALRAIAALMVVAFHAAAIWREGVGVSSSRLVGPWDSGFLGVDIFFVVSGFIMVWVTHELTPNARTAGRFLWNRLTRIFPLWWIFCALMGLYFLVSYGQLAPPPNTAPFATFVASMILWPIGGMPVLNVGWTLTFELGFYALFAATLFLPSRWRPVAIGIWGVVLLLVWGLRPQAPMVPVSWFALWLNPLCLEFVMGAFAAWILLRWQAPVGIGWLALILGAGAGLAVIAMNSLGFASVYQTGAPRVWLFGAPAAFLLIGLVIVERAGRLEIAPWLMDLGDASYSLYLVHLFALLTLKRIWLHFGEIPVSAASFVLFMFGGIVLSVLAAVATHRLLERPLLRLSRAPLAKRGLTRQS